VETAEATSAISDEIEVLACNWATVEVYQRCQLTMHVTMHGVVCGGIAAAEILAAIRLAQVLQKDWGAVAAGVQAMGRIAAQVINAAARAAPQTR